MLGLQLKLRISTQDTAHNYNEITQPEHDPTRPLVIVLDAVQQCIDSYAINCRSKPLWFHKAKYRVASVKGSQAYTLSHVCHGPFIPPADVQFNWRVIILLHSHWLFQHPEREPHIPATNVSLLTNMFVMTALTLVLTVTTCKPMHKWVAKQVEHALNTWQPNLAKTEEAT